MLRKNDVVAVIAGADKGKTGKVLYASGSGSFIVEGVHLVKKHIRPNPDKRVKGGIVERESPIHASNVMFLCQRCNRAVRLGRRPVEKGEKVRYCKKCGEMVDRTA